MPSPLGPSSDIDPQSPGSRWRLPGGWLGSVVALLGLAMLVVAMVQWRQLTLISNALQDDDDAMVVDSHRAEYAYLRLRELWPAAGGAGHGPDAALTLRYEMFVSRIRLLADAAHQALLEKHAELAAGVAAAEAFIKRADPLLDPQRGAEAGTPSALARLEPALEQLGAPLQAMSQRAAQLVAERIALRRDTLREHNRTAVALTLFLSLLTLAFAAIALRQLSRLEQRRQVLEQLTATLHQARRGAEAASAAKSAFLANMSHELRTPFQGLLGMLSLLRETGLAPKQMDYLRTATESADHLLQILNDVLDMSQLESGRLALSPTPVELRVLLRDVEALMRPQAMRKNLALHIDADPAVPERVMLDATRVKQVLFNLLANGIKFSDRGAVVLDLRRLDGGRGPELMFIVTDTGIGMDEGAVQGLFKRFSQGDSSRSRRFGGTGLGLEISRDLARLMDGDITVHSRSGEGSRFSFSLPLVEAPPLVVARRTGPVGKAEAADSLRVLVAEDHDVNRQYLEAVLENLGHRAHFAANGEEAVAAARAHRFDVVLMDLHMPVMDGIAATRAIRALPDATAAAVPIFALTADAFADARQRCLLAGMNDFLTKPIVPQALALSLRRLFGSGGGAQGALDSGSASSRPPRAELSHGQPAALDQAAINSALQAMPRERLVALMATFFAEAPVTLDRLRAAVRDAQPLDLRVNAHALRGAALNLGLAAIAATAEALREGAAHLPAHEIALLVQRFENQLQQAKYALGELRLLTPDISR